MNVCLQIKVTGMPIWSRNFEHGLSKKSNVYINKKSLVPGLTKRFKKAENDPD